MTRGKMIIRKKAIKVREVATFDRFLTLFRAKKNTYKGCSTITVTKAERITPIFGRRIYKIKRARKAKS
jgi:hypothetical protein